MLACAGDDDGDDAGGSLLRLDPHRTIVHYVAVVGAVVAADLGGEFERGIAPMEVAHEAVAATCWFRERSHKTEPSFLLPQ